MRIRHHGAVDGVTGSCHQLDLDDGRSLLIDCGLFQGREQGPDGANAERLHIEFPVEPLAALILTHIHIDHVGRLPHLLAAGYRGPILCSRASAELLPLVLEDALRIGVTRDARLIEQILARLRERTVALAYGQWYDLTGLHPIAAPGDAPAIRLQQAGHILGSAYVEIQAGDERIVFSGDLGAPDTPLLPDPTPLERAEVLVLESTYGDRRHEDRAGRAQRLRALVEHALADGGTVLIPAFSIGRTQELLYEFEALFQAHGPDGDQPRPAWQSLQVVLDSPLAADFTAGYQRLRRFWDEEARARLESGRHPLDFERLVTVESHDAHLHLVNYLAHSRQPAIVIAASGMCAGGRVMDYLKAMLGDPRHDVLFIGYQAAGTPGRDIQHYGSRGGYVTLDGERYPIRAGIHTLGGYSAHADQQNLLDFVGALPVAPREIRLVHGETGAKRALASELRARWPQTRVLAPTARNA